MITHFNKETDERLNMIWKAGLKLRKCRISMTNSTPSFFGSSPEYLHHAYDSPGTLQGLGQRGLCLPRTLGLGVSQSSYVGPRGQEAEERQLGRVAPWLQAWGCSGRKWYLSSRSWNSPGRGEGREAFFRAKHQVCRQRRPERNLNNMGWLPRWC